MRIVHLTPGAGDTFYCENCLRDGALLRALRQAGHEPLAVPLYLPTPAEGPRAAAQVFFGGINVYLQQKLSLFRKTPRWLDRLLDAPALLRWVARRSGMTSARDLGETTLSMLRGENGRQVKELRRLLDFLAGQPRPDVICLSNALLAGLAPALRRELGTPVVCMLQDEDGFLDGLPQPYRKAAWNELADRCTSIDAFIAVSRYYAEAMTSRLGLDPPAVHVVHPGIETADYAPAERSPETPTIGYLAPLCEAKGFGILLDAFAILKPRQAGLRLRAAGGTLPGSARFLKHMRKHIAREGLSDNVEILESFDLATKRQFLPSLSVLSVPTRTPEAFGLFALEALACGVPVVLPNHGAFPELVEATGGGRLCRPNDPEDLARTLEVLLSDEPGRQELGRTGREAVVNRFDVSRTAEEIAAVFIGAIHEESR